MSADRDREADLLLRQRDALVDEIATLHAAIPSAPTTESLTHAGRCGPACGAAEAMWRASPRTQGAADPAPTDS